MIINIDKRGSVNIPASIRKELGLKSGDYMDLSIEEGGMIVLQPVTIYPAIQLNEKGLGKLEQARASGNGSMPDWLTREMQDAETDSE